MQSPQWKFPPHQAGYIAQEPIQREFFTSENMGGLARALVRESVQNALDARRNSTSPVGIRFAVVELQPPDYADYFGGLDQHLEAVDQRYVKALDFRSPLRFLIVEDVNTTGLEGDPAVTYLQEPESGEDFYYFWHNVGRTGKTGSKRGSWGLGKTVFPAISGISTFFGLTTRASDKRRLLMGQSVLRYHKLESGDPITPYGYYGYFDDKSGEPYFCHPIQDQALIDDFCTTFGLLRKPHQSGLSVVIPDPPDEITATQLRLFLLQEYFYPVLTGDLKVRVDQKGSWIAKKENILETIQRTPAKEFSPDLELDKESFLRLLDLVQWTLELPESAYVRIKAINPKNAPHWEKTYDLEAPLAEARQRFEHDNRIAFYVEVPVKQHDKPNKPEYGWFKVFLERDEQLQRAESYFLRNGVWLKHVTGHKVRGIRGVVVIDGEKNPLTPLLASAENPSHTEWQEQSAALRGYYQGVSTLRVVRQSLSRLVGMLTHIDKHVDQDLLRDVFFVERPTIGGRDSATSKGTEKSHDGTVLGDFPEIKSNLQPIVTRPIKGGIEISGADGDENTGRVEAQFAYAVRRGNAFLKYNPLDFDLSHMSVEAHNVQIELREENRLHLQVLKPEFRVRIYGFDPLRDVEMRVHWKETAE